MQGIEVVKAQNGSTTTADNFVLANRVAKGAYDYSLSRGGKVVRRTAGI
ncbi:autotransporter outer membrane beta-barrel domain-containing protein [Yersinia ruckeri]